LIHALPVGKADTEQEVLEIQVHFCRLVPGELNSVDVSGEYVWTHWVNPYRNGTDSDPLAGLDEVAEDIKNYQLEREAQNV